MVTPALLAPGIKARTCHNPIKNQDLNEIFSNSYFVFVFYQPNIKLIANTILEIAINLYVSKIN